MDGDTTGPTRNPGTERLEADRQIARDMVRELRRRGGRPGRPGQPWEKKVEAEQLNNQGVILKNLAARFDVSTSTVGRWVQEVRAARKRQEEGDQ